MNIELKVHGYIVPNNYHVLRHQLFTYGTIFRQNKEGRNLEEIARWDESKKWQKKLEGLKVRLSDADVEVSKLSKENKGNYFWFEIKY